MLGPRDLPLLPVFVAVATTGSYTAAARELRLTKSVVSQHVRTLEERVGVRLLERTTRRVHVTQIGELVLEAARGVASAVTALEHVIEGQREEPSGTLRVTAPNDLAIVNALAPIAAALVRRYAGMRVELITDDAVRDLVKDGLDAAVRLGTLSTSSYVVRRFGEESEIIVAAPSVIEARGAITHPRRLIGAPWVSHTTVGRRSAFTLRSAAGGTQAITVDVRALATTAEAIRQLLIGGVGYGIMPAHIVGDDLRAGRLRRVCPTWSGRRISLHVLTPTRQTPPRVRAFLAVLPGALAQLGFSER